MSLGDQNRVGRKQIKYVFRKHFTWNNEIYNKTNLTTQRQGKQQ